MKIIYFRAMMHPLNEIIVYPENCHWRRWDVAMPHHMLVIAYGMGSSLRRAMG